MVPISVELPAGPPLARVHAGDLVAVPLWRSSGDPEVDAVAARICALDPEGQRFGRVLRQTIDQLLDGSRTGRWDVKALMKTEKTHMGTLVEINLQREFLFDDGEVTDYRIAGTEVDAKYSQSLWSWMLPPEVINHIALVVWSSDVEGLWRAGLLRVTTDLLRQSENRDAKRSLSAAGRDAVYWLWDDFGPDQPLKPNVLLHMDPDARAAIFAATSRAGRHGQARVNELFRQVQGEIVTRTTIETVAQQDDPMKRVRKNGGARGYLAPEGICILGHQGRHPQIAEDLQLPVPSKGEFLAVRLAMIELADPRKSFFVDGRRFAVAALNETAAAVPLRIYDGD